MCIVWGCAYFCGLIILATEEIAEAEGNINNYENNCWKYPWSWIKNTDALLRVAEAIQEVPPRADQTQSQSQAPDLNLDLPAIQDLARNALELDLLPKTSMLFFFDKVFFDSNVSLQSSKRNDRAERSEKSERTDKAEKSEKSRNWSQLKYELFRMSAKKKK